jgi:hypothetical protein
VTLLIFRRVIAGILFEIAFLTGTFDLFGDLDPASGREILKLGAKPVVGSAGTVAAQPSPR